MPSLKGVECSIVQHSLDHTKKTAMETGIKTFRSIVNTSIETYPGKFEIKIQFKHDPEIENETEGFLFNS